MKNILIAGVSCCALLLSSCASIDKYHVPPAGIVNDTRTPENILYGSNLPTNDAKLSTPTSANAYLKQYRSLWDSSYGSSPNLADIDVKALQTTKLGMTLIELRCELFFSAIGRSSQKMDFLHREVEILTSALTSTLGLVGATDDAVAAAGLVSGSTLSSLDNYSNVFFFSPEVGKVQRLVTDAFAILRAETLSSANVPRDFDTTVRALKRYQAICTPHEIRRLVNEAVDAGKVQVFYKDGPSRGGLDPHVQFLFDRIAKVLTASAPAGAVAGLTARQVVLLKWLLQSPTPAEVDFICLALESKDLQDKVCEGDIGARKINANLPAQTRTDLNDLIKATELSTTGWVTSDLDNLKRVYAVQKVRIDGLIGSATTAAAAADRANARAAAAEAVIATAQRAEAQATAPTPPGEPGVQVK